MHESKKPQQEFKIEMIIPDEFIYELKEFNNAKLGGNKPLYVNIIPFPEARELDCGGNVEKVIARYGGKAIKGWRIWWIPGILYEAQAHVIWEKPDGELVDVTPTSDDEKLCLFVRDDRINVVPGADSLNSEYWNIVRHPKVDEYIRAALELAQLIDRGKVVGLTLPCNQEKAQLRRILIEIKELVDNGDICPRRGDSVTEQAIALQKERREIE